MQLKRYERILIIFLLLIVCLIIGVQIGIYDKSKELKKLEEQNKNLAIEKHNLEKELEVWHRAVDIVLCESEFRHIKGRHGEFGIAQFLKPTFDEFKKQMNKPHLNYYSVRDQFEVLLWAIRNGRDKAWVCALLNK